MLKVGLYEEQPTAEGIVL